MKRLGYFSTNLDGWILRHTTREEAKAACEYQLATARDEAVEGWPEETDGLCWGIVVEEARIVSSKPAPEGSDFSDIVEYELCRTGGQGNG